MSSDSLYVAVIVTIFAAVVTALLFYWPWPAKVFLTRERKKAQIIDIVELSHDVKRFRLSLGSKDTILGLPTGKHMVIHAPNPGKCLTAGTWNGKSDPDKGRPEVTRTYTPVTDNSTKGYVDLVIKMYRKGSFKLPNGNDMQWEDGGKMGQFLDDRKVGDWVDVLGPIGIHEYLGKGMFKVPGKVISAKSVGMLAGGTGLTPMLQVVRAAMRDPRDSTNFSLLYANKTEGDILCRDMLDDLARRHKDRFRVTYTLDFPPNGWKQKKGFITTDMIKECLPPNAPDTVVLMCGPPPMIELACKKNLEALGFQKSKMVNF